MHVVLSAMKNAQAAQVGAVNGPSRNASDPFPKWQETFADIGLIKFSCNKGPMMTFKWIVYAQRMVYMIDFMPTEWEWWDFLSHQMIDNTLTWW